MTEKQAIELIENHPAGANLFEKIPKNYGKKEEVKEPIQKKERTHKKKK